MLNEFISYLNEQIGQPYLWGGQHTRLTPETYEAIINKREDGRGGYPNGETYAEATIAFCEKKFNAGAEVLYAYDCSGLGCYWIYNLKKLWKSDINANTMMLRCDKVETEPHKGYWVFRTDDKGKAVHIGYMIDGEYLVEAKGRRYGVVKTKYNVKDWNVVGIPDVFRDDIVNPEPQPEPPEPPKTKKIVAIIGKSVFVRKGDGVLSRIMFTAHKGNHFELIDIAESGWYHIETHKGDGYITNKPKYTKLVEA